MWKNYWQENPITYKNKRVIKSIPQWKCRYMGLTRSLQHNEGNFWCSWIGPNNHQSNGQMLISCGEKNDWNEKSIRWHMLNASCLKHFSNLVSDNYCRKSGLRQVVPEPHSENNSLKLILLQKKRFTGRQWWLPRSLGNIRPIYPILRLNPPPRRSLLGTLFQISWRERLMASHWMSGCGSNRNCRSAWSNLKHGGRQLAFRSSGNWLNSE